MRACVRACVRVASSVINSQTSYGPEYPLRQDQGIKLIDGTDNDDDENDDGGGTVMATTTMMTLTLERHTEYSKFTTIQEKKKSWGGGELKC